MSSAVSDSSRRIGGIKNSTSDADAKVDRKGPAMIPAAGGYRTAFELEEYPESMWGLRATSSPGGNTVALSLDV